MDKLRRIRDAVHDAWTRVIEFIEDHPRATVALWVVSLWAVWRFL